MNSDSVKSNYPSRGYESFGGVAAEILSESERWWPSNVRAPKNVPNVVVILVDDLGFSDTSPFGSEIDTPNIQELSDSGYRFTSFHATPLCAPTRAALLTGVNPHRAGVGRVGGDPGFPGYGLELLPEAATMAESFRKGGYATYMVGKWHLTKDANMHDGADKSSWPLQRGFDRYFGSMDGFTTLFHPHRIIQDNSPAALGSVPDDFYLTDELTRQAISMIDGLRANDAERPFFLYFAHQAVHGPIQAKSSDQDKYRGRYEAGWDVVLEDRLKNQLESGLWPSGLQLQSLRGKQANPKPWDELDKAEKQRFARYMEVYAAVVDSVDQSVGQLMQYLNDIGERDNTIVLFMSDNGATGEGGPEGTRSYFSQFARPAGLPDDWDPDVQRPLELLGSAQVHGHYPQPWARVSNAPFRQFKASAFEGGVRVPLIISWPQGMARSAHDSGVRSQFCHVVDVAPTLFSLTGIEPAKTVNGRMMLSMDGVSFADHLRDPASPSTNRSQYIECVGQRAFFENGWKVVAPKHPNQPFSEDAWELYWIVDDPAEQINLASEQPERVASMADKWRQAAWMNTVFPLDDTGEMLRVRPSSELPLSEPVTLRPSSVPLERYRSSRLTRLRTFTIECSLDYIRGAEGVIVSHGDQGGGYILWLEGGEFHLTYNAYGALHRARCPAPSADGPTNVLVQFDALPNVQWGISLRTGGASSLKIAPVPQMIGLAPFTGISVGGDYGGPVDWDLHARHGTFEYGRGLEWVRFVPGEKAKYNTEIIQSVERLAAQSLD